MCTYKYTHIHTDTHHLYILALEFEIQHMRQGCTQMKKIQKKKKKRNNRKGGQFIQSSLPEKCTQHMLQ